MTTLREQPTPVSYGVKLYQPDIRASLDDKKILVQSYQIWKNKKSHATTIQITGVVLNEEKE